MEEAQNNIDSKLDELATRVAIDFYGTIRIVSGILSLTEKFYEGSHSNYVAQKSEEVAIHLGLNESEIFEIKIAALLHDVGKIGFRDTILQKYPTEMNDSEYKLYTQHSELGKNILQKHSGFNNIAEIIYHHHERLDGSGFPQKLQGKEINPGAAIIGVVDTYHNLMYKYLKEKTPANPITSITSYVDSTNNRFAASMNYLHLKAGILFDRKVVEVFTNIVGTERKNLGHKTIVRLPVNKLEPGMQLAEDYFTSYGLLIAGRGETVTEDIKKSLYKFAEAEEVPRKILVIS